MKRTAVLIILAGFITILNGCGQDQYSMEKEYWYTQKQAEKIFFNPTGTPPAQLQKVIEAQNKFISKYPKSNLAVSSDFNIARLYIVKDEYDKARQQLHSMLKKYSKFEEICANVLFMVGNSYEVQDKWQDALSTYKRIPVEYPMTLRAFDIPLYIGMHYKLKHQPDKMMDAFHEAIEHYQSIANKYPNTPIGFTCEITIAQCYAAIEEWQNAVATYNTVLEKYNGKVAMDQVLLNLGVIYYKQLQDNPKAKEALQRLVKEYPKSSLTKAASQLLKKVGGK